MTIELGMISRLFNVTYPMYDLIAYTQIFLYRIMALMTLAVEAPYNNNSLAVQRYTRTLEAGSLQGQ